MAPSHARSEIAAEPPLEAMLAAWPAAERVQLGDWALRFSGGFTRRANSVLPLGDPGVPLAAAVERCEALYAERGLPACFQLREGHPVAQLSSLLEARGYQLEVPASVYAGRLPAPRSDLRVTQAAEPSDDWLETWQAVEQRPGPDPLARARPILARVSRPRTFALLREDGRPVATVLGTLAGSWLGVSCLAVRAELRRRGLARLLLGCVSAWGREQGADRLWLEVEPGNAPALELYARLGLARVSGYVYRTAASISRTAS